MTFSDLPKDEQPQRGDIIVSAPTENAPQGFLYRVVSVSGTGGTTIVTTEPATIEEAIRNAEVHTKIMLDENVIITDENGLPMEYSLIQDPDGMLKSANLSTGIKIPVDKKIKMGSNFSASLKGEVEIKLSYADFDMKTGDWELQYLTMAIEPQMKANLKGNFEGEIGQDSVLMPITTIPMAPSLFGSASFPSSLRLKLPLTPW
jgi:hypothetical protein